jgi:hypothetical protein
MRRTLHTLTGFLACWFLLSITTTPLAAQGTIDDVITHSSSKVAADHRALAARYRAHAAEHEADAALHDALVADLKARPADDDTWDLARDAAHYAQHSREAAEALRDLAQHHEAIADRLGPAEPVNTPAAGGCCGKGMADKGKAMADKAKGMADKHAPKPAEAGDHAH